jgi:diguanylate cyclase (GGDEF)-like protein
MLDVDHFKGYNDFYGHLGGDDCLREVAQVLIAQPRRGHDCVARYGGEEFVLILPGAGEEDARRIAEEIRLGVQALELEHRGSPTSPVMTVSIGVASFRPELEHEEVRIVAAADQALYAAKRSGRNRVVTASEANALRQRAQREPTLTS